MLKLVGRSSMAESGPGQGRPKKPGGEGKQIRFDSELARMAKFIASEDGVSLGDYLATITRDRILADYDDRVDNLKNRSKKG